MFGKAKPTRPKRERTDNGLAQYGLFDVSMDNNEEEDLGGDDSDLEAELMALSKGGGRTKPKRAPAKALPATDLDAMVAESMKDIGSDEELSGDDDDPDLLNELGEIAGDDLEPEAEPTPASPKQSPINAVKLLEDRLKMYQTAEQNAKEGGETARARRFGRGINTLKDLLKQAKAGKAINNDDIPPEVAVNIQKRPSNDTDTTVIPSRPAPGIPSPQSDEPSSSTTGSPKLEEPSSPKLPSPEQSQLTPENEELIKLLNGRKNEYKMAALEAKKSDDTTTAMKYIKIAKQFETVIKAVENGQPVDLSNMPGPPGQVEQLPEQTSTGPTVPLVQNELQTESPDEPLPEPTLITASSVGEALQQRLEVYQKQEASAKEQGNASKARRMGRIVKQFEDAIKLNKAGKPVPIEDLPNPPGYAPIPGSAPKVSEPEQKPPPVATKPEPAQAPTPSHPTKSNAAQSRIDKQVALLISRQKEFKEAALQAKQKGELTQAKEYLRSAKGFDPLIEAARGGLPVDIESLPVPPSARSQLDKSYEIVESSEIDPEHLDILTRLEQQLSKQLNLCITTRDHNKAIGDVAGMNRFEQLALSVTRDLDLIVLAKKGHNVNLPKFHYETKNFSIVKSCTDLTDNDLELTIIRGLNYACSNPSDIDTYVKFEFPFPQDVPVTNKTVVVRNTNSPEYNATFNLPIQRTSRPCQRVFKRHGIKLEIYSKGGFFRGDTLIGTTLVKLQPLETQCELHDSFELVEGRKKVGGKLEVRLRVRDPIVTRQIEQLSEKWLVLDH